MSVDPETKQLLEQLKSNDDQIRDRATQALWEQWFQQKGLVGYNILIQSQMLMNASTFEQAEALLTDLIESQPDFAEAWNRRAVLYYVQRRYRAAIADCDQVIRQFPFHFGAIHGKALCHMALGEWHMAIAAFQQALAIQPHSLENQRMLLECMSKLS